MYLVAFSRGCIGSKVKVQVHIYQTGDSQWQEGPKADKRTGQQAELYEVAVEKKHDKTIVKS